MTIQKCRIGGCGLTFQRPAEAPIPSDICTRCWDEMRELFPASAARAMADRLVQCEACGSVEGQYHAPECPSVNVFEAGRIRREEAEQ